MELKSSLRARGHLRGRSSKPIPSGGGWDKSSTYHWGHTEVASWSIDTLFPEDTLGISSQVFWIITMVWSLTSSQTSWNAKSSGPWKTSLWINLVEVMEFQLSYFKSQKMMLHLICQQIWKTLQWPWDWKRSVFIPIPKKGNAKECSNYRPIALILHTW